jgi:hypothetical protein
VEEELDTRINAPQTRGQPAELRLSRFFRP